MTSLFKIISVLMGSLFFLSLGILNVAAAQGSTGIILDVVCNNNKVCEPQLGENSANCENDCSAIISTPGSPPQSLGLPVIHNLSVSDITLVSARITWDTGIASRCQIAYGEKNDYDAGAVSEIDLVVKHDALLAGLASGEIYYFKITCANANGKTSETGPWKFSTLTPPDATPPANVSGFQAVAGDGSVGLEWSNPGDSDFAGVRIVRSERFYPADPWAGQIVYDGKGASFKDRNLENGKAYYYAAFAYDKSENYSSGAVAAAIPGRPGKIPEIPVVAAPAEIQKIDLPQFEFTQDGKKIEPQEGQVAVNRLRPLTISIPYEAVPEVLKTIMVTLKQGDKAFLFLLRVNKEKTAYTATLVPPDSGVYPFDITILDYKNRAFKKISGQFDIAKAQLSDPVKISKYLVTKKAPLIIYIILAIIVGLIAGKIYREARKRRNKSQSTNSKLQTNYK